MHARVADVHGAVDRLDLHTILAGAHRVAAAVNRISEFSRQRCVTTRAVDDGARDTALMGNERQNVSPHGGVLASTVVEHHDASGFDLVDVITNRARRLPRRPVEDRERPASQAEARVEWLDVQTLPRNAESIE